MLERFLELFQSIPAGLVIAAAFLLPAAETALLVGLLVPGELTVVAAGVAAARGGAPLAAVIGAAALGSIAGDSIGFFVGRRLRRTIKKNLSVRRWNRAQEWLKRKGMPAIFLARFTPFLRSVMPPAAGAARIRYPVFFPWCAAAGLLWGAGSVLLGYFAARHAALLVHWVGVIAFVLLAAFLVMSWSRRRRRIGRRVVHRRRPAGRSGA